MKLIQFKEKESDTLYNQYLDDCRNATKILSNSDQEECLMEINSFIYEFMEDHHSEGELFSLKTILQRLGDPSITLKETIASRKVDQASRTYNLLHIFEAIYLNLRNGFLYILMAILALLLSCFPILAIFKLIYPNKVGFWIGEGTYVVLGFSDSTSNAEEYLGDLFIPFVLGLSVVLYFIIILLLKIVKRNRK